MAATPFCAAACRLSVFAPPSAPSMRPRRGMVAVRAEGGSGINPAIRKEEDKVVDTVLAGELSKPLTAYCRLTPLLPSFAGQCYWNLRIESRRFAMRSPHLYFSRSMDPSVLYPHDKKNRQPAALHLQAARRNPLPGHCPLRPGVLNNDEASRPWRHFHVPSSTPQLVSPIECGIPQLTHSVEYS
ncbi:hypothetical protein PR202_gb20732 [Eleusine coracana subsp. coracana]|uniref:Uncharacterized protein n=1 Tax=Eleusine coracana subsp. coracana TaxID=191504 RepID=A0AAV5FB78_ELECO|nr:hypothetical protein PR202_gb20732 [Eleusine coracana subsp. coracana]